MAFFRRISLDSQLIHFNDGTWYSMVMLLLSHSPPSYSWVKLKARSRNDLQIICFVVQFSECPMLWKSSKSSVHQWQRERISKIENGQLFGSWSEKCCINSMERNSYNTCSDCTIRIFSKYTNLQTHSFIRWIKSFFQYCRLVICGLSPLSIWISQNIWMTCFIFHWRKTHFTQQYLALSIYFYQLLVVSWEIGYTRDVMLALQLFGRYSLDYVID